MALILCTGSIVSTTPLFFTVVFGGVGAHISAGVCMAVIEKVFTVAQNLSITVGGH